MIFLQFLLIFSAFPTIIFGIQCAGGSVCYDYVGKNTIVDVPIKTCKDACVYFKCMSRSDLGSIHYKEGVGCLEDFLNVCKYTPTNVKEDVTKNIKNYSIKNDDLIFRSCSDKDGCATNGLESWATDNVLFNIGPAYHAFNKTCYKYEPKPSKNDTSTAKCDRYIVCQSGKLYFAKDQQDNWLNDKKYGDRKKCDACLDFKCTNDGGNTVVQGNGCWDDFVYACPSIPENVKENIKKNIKDSFYYDKNYIVTSCGPASVTFNTCDLSFYYKRYNSLAAKIFDANVNKAFDEICHIDFATPSPPPTKSYHSINGHSNGIEMKKLILFGLIFINFL